MLYNRICRNCGGKYYACNNCIKINSWKNICCSRDCYRQYSLTNGEILPIELKGRINMNNAILRAGLLNGGTISITGYDLELGKFDCSDGKTRVFNEFEYFIVPTSEMEEISKRLSEKVEEPKKISKKNNKETISEDIE